MKLYFAQWPLPPNRVYIWGKRIDVSDTSATALHLAQAHLRRSPGATFGELVDGVGIKDWCEDRFREDLDAQPIGNDVSAEPQPTEFLAV